ncbi:SIS domain-containing protein [Roseospirillum parvum]|uniref:D-sedoheptulose 7-phosphate isomerase/D-glycero-D-manno-heptose 1,7-bisphosphate phosphatase n=1 Tax=Roseospirillum parvum TaxID=83401 RepID=A0A1G7TV85_9PROT|nr:SIS domain-containing protein [Roseospirillum parvum]SDG39041.1 D-sedoheptulose 7-phosphate isomerase/D-glycero-D-manno-heptose 1,7-bisphosphate phosphatase [Roseospirillum parvum]
MPATPPLFPDRPYAAPADFLADYQGALAAALAGVDAARFEAAATLLGRAVRERRTLFYCGNGGSSALAGHGANDFLKCVRTETDLAPRTHSLAANTQVLTTIANDLGYENIFVYQLQSLADPGDVLVTISSSGDSENVVRALSWAVENGLSTLALTGFSGGRAATLAEVNLHVPATNYGLIEDAHLSLLHALAQYVRLTATAPDKLGRVRF